MVNKKIFYIILFVSAFAFSQTAADSLAVTEPPTVHSTEETTPTPRTFEDAFQKKYTGEEFQYEAVVKKSSKWEDFKAWLNYWLSRIFSFGTKGNVSVFEVVVKTLAILIVLFVVYLIVKAILNKEGNWIFGKSTKKKISASEFHEDDIHNIDFKDMIEKNKAENNYRLTIRYYYLWLLKRMSDSHVIEWDIEKTNSDYLYEIKRDALKEDFRYLSYIYDYSWYGEFAIDSDLFERAEKTFIKTINSV